MNLSKIMHDTNLPDKIDYRIVFVAPGASSSIIPSMCSQARIKPPSRTIDHNILLPANSPLLEDNVSI